MKKLVTLFSFLTSFSFCFAQLGIGTTQPAAGLHIIDSNVVFSGQGEEPTIPTPLRYNSPGRKFIWHAGKAAFRAGYTSYNQWNEDYIGRFSFAAGIDTRASGEASVALGYGAAATADRSFAFNGTATGVGSIALGSGAQATNDDALAFGPSSISSGLASVAIGPSIAPGNFAVAIGLQNRAAGQFSTAIGKNARANHQGSMVLGDAGAGFSSDSVYSTANNQMTMRFLGGYKLFTTQNVTTAAAGVQLAAGGGSWSSVSDFRKKENFYDINNEEILQKLSSLKISGWNYLSQPATHRHIGPMAQDFYAAFQLDGIGNDTTINSLDFDGINMAAIQALEKRSTVQASHILTVQKELQQKDEAIATLQKEVQSLKEKLNTIDQLEQRLLVLEKQIQAAKKNVNSAKE